MSDCDKCEGENITGECESEQAELWLDQGGWLGLRKGLAEAILP